jgi:hypothetical protein
MSAITTDFLAEANRTTVSQLSCPVSKLMSTVAGGIRLHAGQQLVPAQYASSLFRLKPT